ncbi:hypothetical protein DFJ74DRAFT_683075 [Hyaloraphidium curvatum]|nr:hypothetical protein DFJ74DRAFT_683075 [Hyaloraphidium curvatum]
MKAILIRRAMPNPRDAAGCVEDVPAPACPPDGLLIKIVHVSVNFPDILLLAGTYQYKPELPFVPCHEYSGVVAEVGPRAAQNPHLKHLLPLQPGTRVYGSVAPYITGGCARELLAVVPRSSHDVNRVPPELSLREACGFRGNYVTSWHGLVDRAKIREGEWVLVNAAAGGVGCAAVQIAKYFNCTVVATCGSAEKMEVCRQLGADYVFDYSADPDWAVKVKELTVKAGKKFPGVDVFFDIVGQLEAGLKCCAPHSRVMLVGFTGRTPQTPERVRTNILLVKQINVLHVTQGGTFAQFPELWEPAIEGVGRLFASRLKPKPLVFGKRYKGLDKVGEALEDLASRKSYGKVVIDVAEDPSSEAAKL